MGKLRTDGLPHLSQHRFDEYGWLYLGEMPPPRQPKKPRKPKRLKPEPPPPQSTTLPWLRPGWKRSK